MYHCPNNNEEKLHVFYGHSFPPTWFEGILLQPTACQLNRLFTYII